MTKDVAMTTKINRLRSENKNLQAELKNLKEAFNDAQTSPRPARLWTVRQLTHVKRGSQM